jgi:tetratricopeptide (TPR) repeat protein
MSRLEMGEVYRDKLERMLSDDRQYNLDLAGYYFNAGLLEDALQVIEEAVQNWDYPILAYLAAYISYEIGNQTQAHHWLSKTADADPNYVFPSRLEEALALQYALKQVPQDYKAMYYLGNFMWANQRFEESLHLWQSAAQGLTTLDVLYRNLGWAAWQREENHQQAIVYFEKALTLNPRNQDLYLHLDDLYKAQNLVEQRRQLLDIINALPDVREDVHKHSIQILVELGSYEEALKIMQSEKFIPLEMDQSFHNLYVRALMQRAEAHIQSGQMETAISDYNKALEFPTNLGVGAPTSKSQADIYYHLGLAYEKMGLFQESLVAWRNAAQEHHAHDTNLYNYVQMALDKLSRYSELGLDS